MTVRKMGKFTKQDWETQVLNGCRHLKTGCTHPRKKSDKCYYEDCPRIIRTFKCTFCKEKFKTEKATWEHILKDHSDKLGKKMAETITPEVLDRAISLFKKHNLLPPDPEREETEIERRLRQGETLVCPDCELFYPDSEECEIICCNDPFKGPDPEEIIERAQQVTEAFYKHRLVN